MPVKGSGFWGAHVGRDLWVGLGRWAADNG